MNTYEIREDGVIEVNGLVPVLDGLPLQDLQTEARLNGANVAERAAEYGVSYAHLMGIQHGEGVIPRARQLKIPETEAWTIESFDHGLGYFQITNNGLKKDKDGRPLSRDEVLDPFMNADIAARFVRTIQEKVGPDLVKTAAIYNAGSLRPPTIASPWPYHTFRANYIDEVVAASNTIHLTMPTPPGGVRNVVRKFLKVLGFSLMAASLGFVAFEASKR